MPQRPTGAQSNGFWHELRRRGLFRLLVAILVVVVIAVVVVLVLLARSDDQDQDTTDDTSDSGVVVTSPYDFSELPADVAPADAAQATYVSILLVEGQDELTSYGLKHTVPAAKALLDAVVKAREIDDPDLGSSTAATDAGEPESLSSSLTFRFEDMSTLTFDLHVEQGLIARDGRAWRVDGDLGALVQDAIAAVQS